MFTRLSIVARSAAAAALVSMASVASAQTGYSGIGPLNAAAARTSFQAALSGFTVNTLSSLTPDDDLGALSFGGITAQASNVGRVRDGTFLTVLTDGPTVRGVTGMSEGNVASITFSEAINGFGADWGDLGDFPSINPITQAQSYGLTYRFFSSTTLVGQYSWDFGTGLSGETRTFFGAINSVGFNRVELVTAFGDAYEFDNPTIGTRRTSVPEPSTLGTTAAGLLALMMVSRKRRTNA